MRHRALMLYPPPESRMGFPPLGAEHFRDDPVSTEEIEQ